MVRSRPLTRREVRDIDRTAIEQYGIPGVVLMENAGRGTTQHIRNILHDQIDGRSVIVVCGGGNNGGDGLVIARHLYNAGAAVTVLLAAEPSRLKGDAAINLRIVQAMNLPIVPCVTDEQVSRVATLLPTGTLIVDALLGTGFAGQVRSPMEDLIQGINAAGRQGVKIVSVDIPSGLDCDTGQVEGTAIRADLTVTFVAPKVGLLVDSAGPYVGRIEVVDIGVPREIVPVE